MDNQHNYMIIQLQSGSVETACKVAPVSSRRQANITLSRVNVRVECVTLVLIDARFVRSCVGSAQACRVQLRLQHRLWVYKFGVGIATICWRK